MPFSLRLTGQSDRAAAASRLSPMATYGLHHLDLRLVAAESWVFSEEGHGVFGDTSEKAYVRG